MMRKRFGSILIACALLVSCFTNPIPIHATEIQTPQLEVPQIDYTVYVDQVAALADKTEDQKRYRSLCPAYEAGQMVYLNSSADRDAFMDYYRNSYNLYSANSWIGYWYGENKSKMPAESDKRAACILATIEKFGIPTGDDAFGIVRDACSRVRNGMQYNNDFRKINYLDSLTLGTGVCVHYNRAAYILLNAAGIPTRMASGYRSGSSHAWNECFINGVWYVVDFTEFADKNCSPDGFVAQDYLPLFVETSTMTIS